MGQNRKPNNKGNKSKRSYNERKQSKNDFKGGGYKVLPAHLGDANDPDWYMQLPTQAADATRISFFNQLGAALDIFRDDSKAKNSRVPGIMGLKMVTTPGTTSDSHDALNLAAINLYEYVRKSLNKPNPDYEAQDLIMMVFSIIDIYSQYCDIVRAYGILGQWNMDNLYTPKAIMKAAYGWNSITYDNQIKKIADTVADFNLLVDKAQFLFLPTDFKIMDRQSWLFSNVFRDHSRQKSQYYVHRKDNYWMFDEQTSDTGSRVLYMDYPEVKTFEVMLDRFNTCIEALRNSSSCRIMQSDLRKAFENSNNWQMATLDMAYHVAIVDSDEVLMQIENTQILADWPSYTEKDLVQNVDENRCYYQPKISKDYYDYSILTTFKPLINLHTDDTSPATIMVATRGMPAYINDIGSQLTLFVSSDFCSGTVIVTNPDDLDDIYEWDGLYDANMAQPDWGSVNVAQLIAKINILAAFDWAPKAYTHFVDSEAKTDNYYPVLEWDNYTTITNDMLTRIHTVANLSMWRTGIFSSWK